MCVCVCVCVYVCVCVCACVHVYIHVCLRMCLFVYIYMCILRRSKIFDSNVSWCIFLFPLKNSYSMIGIYGHIQDFNDFPSALR